MDKGQIVRAQDRKGRTKYRPVIKAHLVDVPPHPMDSAMETTMSGTLVLAPQTKPVPQIVASDKPVKEKGSVPQTTDESDPLTPPSEQLQHLNLLSWVAERVAKRMGSH